MKSQISSDAKARVLCVTTYELGEESASTRALNVAGALRDSGYAVTIHQHVNRRDPSIRKLSGKRIEGITRELIISSRPATFLRHYSRVVRGDYDVVIANNMNGALYALFGRLHLPLLLDLHGDMVAELDMELPPGTVDPPLRFRVRRASYELTEFVTRKLSNRISCVSRKMLRVLRKRGFPENRLLYVPNCVDLEFFSPRTGEKVDMLRRRIGVGTDKLLVGYLGRSHPWQGNERFVEAARTLNSPDLAFLVVGTGQTSTEGNVHFCGDVALADMPNFYSICDAFVLPRPSHPATDVAAPTKFAEYAAMGRPIVASAVGDAADLIRESDCGIVVNDNSPGELSRGIRQLLQLTDDRRDSMGFAARKLAETEFSLDIAREKLSKGIDELTTRR